MAQHDARFPPPIRIEKRSVVYQDGLGTNKKETYNLQPGGRFAAGRPSYRERSVRLSAGHGPRLWAAESSG